MARVPQSQKVRFMMIERKGPVVLIETFFALAVSLLTNSDTHFASHG